MTDATRDPSDPKEGAVDPKSAPRREVEHSRRDDPNEPETAAVEKPGGMIGEGSPDGSSGTERPREGGMIGEG